MTLWARLVAIVDRFRRRSKTAAVDPALVHLAVEPVIREEALAMRGAHAMGDVPEDDGPGS
jgi:hypothetical protein